MKIYTVKFSAKSNTVTEWRETVSLWVVGRSCEHAAAKGKAHARKHFDDKRAVLEGVTLAGTVDVA